MTDIGSRDGICGMTEAEAVSRLRDAGYTDVSFWRIPEDYGRPGYRNGLAVQVRREGKWRHCAASYGRAADREVGETIARAKLLKKLGLGHE